MMDRAVWEYDNSGLGGWHDEQMEVTVAADHVLFVIVEEHAVDSYNDTFRNGIALPYAKVRELVEVLQSALKKTPTA